MSRLHLIIIAISICGEYLLFRNYFSTSFLHYGAECLWCRAKAARENNRKANSNGTLVQHKKTPEQSANGDEWFFTLFLKFLFYAKRVHPTASKLKVSMLELITHAFPIHLSRNYLTVNNFLSISTFITVAVPCVRLMHTILGDMYRADIRTCEHRYLSIGQVLMRSINN